MHVELGLMAASIKEQFPKIDTNIADRFEKANQCISFLKICGYMSDAEKRKIVGRLIKDIEKEL